MILHHFAQQHPRLIRYSGSFLFLAAWLAFPIWMYLKARKTSIAHYQENP